jgi:hypothetical protein
LTYRPIATTISHLSVDNKEDLQMLNEIKSKSKQSLINLAAKQVSKHIDINSEKQEELSSILDEVVEAIGVSNIIFLGLKAKEIADLKTT